MNTTCPALTGTVAATIPLAGCDHELIVSNPIAAIVYLKFNWTTGDAEVSATNFDTLIIASNVTRLPVIKVTNARALCSGSGSLGIMCW